FPASPCVATHWHLEAICGGLAWRRMGQSLLTTARACWQRDWEPLPNQLPVVGRPSRVGASRRRDASDWPLSRAEQVDRILRLYQKEEHASYPSYPASEASSCDDGQLRSLALLQSLNASLSDMAHASRQMRRAAMDCAQQGLEPERAREAELRARVRELQAENLELRLRLQAKGCYAAQTGSGRRSEARPGTPRST
ncbi:unnamed protein product, partial [Effrenium voratum]